MGLKPNVLWIYGGCYYAAFVFAYFMIPETTQLTPKQIDLLRPNATPRTSPTYRRYILEKDTRQHQPGGGDVTKPGTENVEKAAR
ncbi:Plasma membrane low glucose sensor [Vanrija albida]|uniref:Plasma membrane low glucose sensor n=1 Tax=Vanrija albida TaxID=181172 RepID=A0ABR3Q1I9_9TREE